MGRADEAGAGSYALPQRQASFRFRDDTTSLLRRARRAVAEWHREQRGSAEELVAGIGGEFPEAYFPVLRTQLAVLQGEVGSPRPAVLGSGAEVTDRGAVELGDVIWHGERFEASAAFPGLPEHVRTARRFVSLVLDQGHPRGELAVQLVSELVTNSVQHSGSADPEGTISVTVSGTLTSVTVEVADAGGTQVPASALRREPGCRRRPRPAAGRRASQRVGFPGERSGADDMVHDLRYGRPNSPGSRKMTIRAIRSLDLAFHVTDLYRPFNGP